MGETKAFPSAMFYKVLFKTTRMPSHLNISNHFPRLAKNEESCGHFIYIKTPLPQAGTAHDRNGIAHVIVKTSSAPQKPVHSSPKIF